MRLAATDGRASSFFCKSLFKKRPRALKTMISYQMFFHIAKRFFGHSHVNLPPTCSFPLENCPWKPPWYIFQYGEKVYPEGSHDGSFSKSIQGFPGDRDIGIVGLLNVNSICDFHNSGGKCTCFLIILSVPCQSDRILTV